LPTWRQQPRGSTVDRHAEHLDRRWSEGCYNAAQLWREIKEQGNCRAAADGSALGQRSSRR